MKTTAFVLTCLLLCSATLAVAQPLLDRSHILGAGLQMSYPFDEFKHRQTTGWGLHALLDYPLFMVFNLTGDVGFNHFGGQETHQALTVWEFAVGAKVVFGAFFMGGDVAYYTEADDTSWVPSIGLRFTRWEVAARIKALGRDHWSSLRIGYYF